MGGALRIVGRGVGAAGCAARTSPPPPPRGCRPAGLVLKRRTGRTGPARLGGIPGRARKSPLQPRRHPPDKLSKAGPDGPVAGTGEQSHLHVRLTSVWRWPPWPVGLEAARGVGTVRRDRPETPKGPVVRPLMRSLPMRLSPPVSPEPAVPSGSCASGSPSAEAGRRSAPAVPRSSVPRHPRGAPASCGAGWLCCGTSSSSSLLLLTSPVRRPGALSSALSRARVVGFAIPVKGQAKHAIPVHCREGAVKVVWVCSLTSGQSGHCAPPSHHSETDIAPLKPSFRCRSWRLGHPPPLRESPQKSVIYEITFHIE